MTTTKMTSLSMQMKIWDMMNRGGAAHAGALCQTAEIDGDCRSNDHNKSGISHIIENPALFRFVEPLGGIFCFFHMKYSFVFYS